MRYSGLFIFLITTAISGLCYGQVKETATSFWFPVTEQERQTQAPVVEKDAGVEALFTRVYVADEFRGEDPSRAFRHYVRLKVFNEKGKQAVSTIDIPYSGDNAISGVAARTIKPDGTILAMKDDAVFDREVVRARGLKRKVKSFAIPGVEPGVIVEYRYTEFIRHPSMMYVALQFQRDFPVRKATVSLWPLDLHNSAYRMYFVPLNCNPTGIERELNGYYSSTLENVPAFREEPMMPGEPNVRPWSLAVYRDDGNRNPDKYWQSIGKRAYDELREAMKPNDEMKRAAVNATEGAANETAKIDALIRYVQANVRGLFDKSVTDAERAEVLKSRVKGKFRTAQQVYKSGVATSDEMNTLFAGLASAVGLDARPAFVADRQSLIFNPELADIYFLPNIDMAVQIDGAWKVYDVSTRDLPAGMLSWREEGMSALISDPKKSVFVTVPVSRPEASGTVREAHFTLSSDGTLEGDVVETNTGHRAAERRSQLGGESAARREEILKDNVRESLTGADVTGIAFENIEERSKPVIVRFHLRAPAYAQRTGRRLLFQPLVLQKGDPPLFSASERRHPIIIPYAYTESDKVTIRVPTGVELDHAESPGDMTSEGFFTYKLKMGVKDGEFVASRNVQVGMDGHIVFPAKLYTPLKNLFDRMHERDNHVIALLTKAGGLAPQPTK